MLSMNLEFYNSPGARPPMFSVPIDIPDVRLLNVQISSKGEFIRVWLK